jgi:hypothetical protein
LDGHCDLVELLAQRGADIQPALRTSAQLRPDGPSRYMREMNSFLGVELNDFAPRRGNVKWTACFLERFPTLRQAVNEHSAPFELLAQQSGNPAIARRFESDADS